MAYYNCLDTEFAVLHCIKQAKEEFLEWAKDAFPDVFGYWSYQMEYTLNAKDVTAIHHHLALSRGGHAWLDLAAKHGEKAAGGKEGFSHNEFQKYFYKEIVPNLRVTELKGRGGPKAVKQLHAYCQVSSM